MDVAAVRRLFEAKGRPANDPLIVHVATVEQAAALTIGMSDDARALGAEFWPGPLTMVLPRHPGVPTEVTAGLDTVAIRIPAHPIARALLEAAQIPVAAPSANLFSRPSPTTAAHVQHDLEGRIDIIIDGGATPLGVESTVVDVTLTPPRVLRPGGISLEKLRRVVPGACVTNSTVADTEAVASPGLLSHHYSPRTPMALYLGETGAARTALARRIEEATSKGLKVGVLAMREHIDTFRGVPVTVADLGSQHDADEVARRLYASMRQLDAAHLDLILAHLPTRSDGVWSAITDRLSRAATEHVTVP